MEPESDWGHEKAKHILQRDRRYLEMLRYRYITKLNVSEAGTSGSSSPLNVNTSHSSSADFPAGSDDLDAQTDKKHLKRNILKGFAN